jgi:hypothetical protein
LPSLGSPCLIRQASWTAPQRPTLVRCPRGAHAVCPRTVASQARKPSSSLAQQFATRYTSQGRDQITQGIEDDFLDSQSNHDTQAPTHSINHHGEPTLPINRTTLEMDQGSYTASSASQSEDELLYIDPQLLRLDRDHNLVTSPSATNTLSTIGNSLEMTGGISDEAAAGRG